MDISQNVYGHLSERGWTFVTMCTFGRLYLMMSDYQQISSAYQKWNRLKQVLLDLKNRVKFQEAYTRSRLLFSVQALQINSGEMKKNQIGVGRIPATSEKQCTFKQRF